MKTGGADMIQNPYADYRKGPISGGELATQLCIYRGIPTSSLARVLNLEPKTLRRFLKGDYPVTPTLAEFLSDWSGISYEMWLMVDEEYQIEHPVCFLNL